MTVFYDFSGGMESAAMLVVDRDRIRDTAAIVRWADTGKHFPEMYQSIAEIEMALRLKIVLAPQRIDFDTYLFERGGMVKKGTNDCSRKMKRSNLMRHAKTFDKPYEINLGFNSDEDKRADDFSARNERDWCHWRYPLIESGITREATWKICADAGFKTIIAMYEKMGRFDCYFCGNQTPSQARKVLKHYPDLAAEWKALEARKGHSFMRKPLAQIENEMNDDGLFTGCSCFGGTDNVWEDEE